MNLEALNLAELKDLISKRDSLRGPQTTLLRGIHTTETAGQFSLDIANNVGILSLYKEMNPEIERSLALACTEAAGLQSVYLKRRPIEAKHSANVIREYLSPESPVVGNPESELIAVETGVSYFIRPGQDLSIGLFTDARVARQWVRANTPPRVLNCFAYTCGFGLNAVLGGAEVVKNVDLSRKVLEWGKENYTLNHQEANNHDFLYGDVFEWLRRLQKRSDQFDLIILDPPSFARHKTGMWRAEKDYGKLAALAAAVAAPGARLLTLLNHAGVPSAQFEQQVTQGLSSAGRQSRLAERLPVGLDYPQAQHLKTVVWQLD